MSISWPKGLLSLPPFLAFYTILLATASVAKQPQCRLQLAQAGAISPDQPFPTGTGTPGSNGTTPNTTIPPLNFKYGTDKIRGVNLGGWFVLEPWITPGVFESTGNDDIIDEFTLGQLANSTFATELLQRHWETWYTEDDFKAMKAAGLNHVRIPLGYWSVPMNDSVSVEPYIPGAWPYFLRALNWAKASALNIIVDLHGAPGSQNGYDNSGQLTSNPQWALDMANVNRTLAVLSVIAEQAGGMIDVIELLNEAAGFRSSQWQSVVRDFWQNGYSAVRSAAGGGIKVMIGDAFLGVGAWENFMQYPSAQGVLMDVHQYQIFSVEELQRTEDEHITFACNLNNTYAPFDEQSMWTVVGEWTTANTDCAKWLNGRGVGSRWDGTHPSNTNALGSCTGLTGDSSTFSSDFKAYMRKYWEAQVDVAESSNGWVYWTWKTEITDEWSYSKGVEGGWIPKDPTERMHPGLCSNSTN